MTQPIVFISHFMIKVGRAEALRELHRMNTARLEADKPRTLTFLAFADDAGERISFVHVFADAESMDAHTQGVDERAREALECLEPLGWEIYGRPSDAAIEMMRGFSVRTGAPVRIDPEFVGGFLRLQPA
jgi:hypothetical protein